jgi:hypothetical protein
VRVGPDATRTFAVVEVDHHGRVGDDGGYQLEGREPRLRRRVRLQVDPARPKNRDKAMRTRTLKPQ